MEKNRLEAFSDGVLAIIITIMVLELKVPQSPDLAELKRLFPVFLTYVLSFVYLGIYWNNHHHLLKAAGRVNGAMMWANLHLLFWLSLFPFVTGWMGENHFTTVPTAVYGTVLLLAAIAYYILQSVIIAGQGCDSKLAAAIGRDFKGSCLPFFMPSRWRRRFSGHGFPAVFTCWWRSCGWFPTAGLNACSRNARIDCHSRLAALEF